MLGDVLLIAEKHQRAGAQIVDRLNEIESAKVVVAIGGESGSGKSELAHVVARALKDQGRLAKILHIDNYYTVRPQDREAWRKENGLESIGLGEIDWELLETHNEGVIATTGCLGGHVLQSLMNDSFDNALEKAARLQDIFGRDNLFVELQDHGIPEQHRTNPQLLEIARAIGAPILATNDSHYTLQQDHSAHDALLCVQTGSEKSDPDRFRFHGDQHYLKSAAEMRHMFREVEVACDNTLWIAERCDVEIEFGEPRLLGVPFYKKAGTTMDAFFNIEV